MKFLVEKEMKINLEKSTKTTSEFLHDGEVVEDLRRQMLKFATQQLGDFHLAEDAVQDALIGALKNVASFGGRAALKTWVFAILKNKIADVLRSKQKTVNVSSLQGAGEEDENEDFMSLFDQKGRWNQDDRPSQWCDPEASLSQKDFWIVFEACLDHLPPKQARIFMMREFIELETDEICEAADITINLLFVTLYRARMRLRECMDMNWYQRSQNHAELS
jgi:RNA polymerase sigma-70 factor (TIGR02943 family)